jgi:hypothetical protein
MKFKARAKADIMVDGFQVLEYHATVTAILTGVTPPMTRV